MQFPKKINKKQDIDNIASDDSNNSGKQKKVKNSNKQKKWKFSTQKKETTGFKTILRLLPKR